MSSTLPGSQNHDVGWVSLYHMSVTVDLCWRSHLLVSTYYNWRRRSQLQDVLSSLRSSIVQQNHHRGEVATIPSPKSGYWGFFRSCWSRLYRTTTGPAPGRDYWGFSLCVSLTSLVLTIANTVAVPLDDTWYWGLLIVYASLLQDTLSRVPPTLALMCCYHPPWGRCLYCRIRCHVSAQLFFRPLNVL